MSDLKETLIAIIEDIAPDADMKSIPDSENFREAFNMDSMDFLSIVERVATDLNVEIPEADYETVQNLSGMIAYIQAHS